MIYPAIAPTRKPPPPGPTHRDVRRVLVLDDEPEILRMIGRSLTASGVTVVTCREMEAALALLAHAPFDVLLTDLEVSPLGGLEGMRLVQHVAGGLNQTRIIALSGHATSPRVKDLASALGASLVLAKPVSMRTLRAHVLGDFLAQEPVVDGAVDEVDLLDDLLAGDGISSVLQPIVSLTPRGGRHAAIAVECLARVVGSKALRNPEVLFSYALAKGRVVDADMLAVRAGLAEAGRLDASCAVFLNANPRTISDPAFADRLAEAAAAAGIDRTRLVLELTEQQEVTDRPALGRNVESLRATGVRFALDDYGDAFAGLLAIETLRPDFLKITGRLTEGIATDPRRRAMLVSTVELAQGLGIPTILERIETPDELRIARDAGIDYGQGYLFARPAPAKELLAAGGVRIP